MARKPAKKALSKKTQKRTRGGAAPRIDDEVLVSFTHGDLRKPVGTAALWNGDKPPAG